VNAFFASFETAGLPFPKWNFFDVSAPENRFLATGETVGFPFAKWTFLDVSELVKAFSPFRRNGRLTFSEMTLFPTFRDLKIFSSPPAKRPGSRSRSNHFWTFRSLWKRFLPSVETAGLPFPKWPFFRRFGTWKSFPRHRRNGRVPVLLVQVKTMLSLLKMCESYIE
jgi:hypothetical protein